MFFIKINYLHTGFFLTSKNVEIPNSEKTRITLRTSIMYKYYKNLTDYQLMQNSFSKIKSFFTKLSKTAVILSVVFFTGKKMLFCKSMINS